MGYFSHNTNIYHTIIVPAQRLSAKPCLWFKHALRTHRHTLSNIKYLIVTILHILSFKNKYKCDCWEQGQQGLHLNLPRSGRVEVKINKTNNSECYLHDHDVSASLDKYL